VLNCKSRSLYDNSSRTCRCPNSTPPAPLFSCVNSTLYPFGCFCSNGTFHDSSSQRCLASKELSNLECKDKEVGYSGLCLSCPANCLNCSTGAKNVKFLMCTSCIQEYTLTLGRCVSTSCVPNCLECQNGTCITCAPLYALLNSFCIRTFGYLPRDLPDWHSISS
jgi:hypothetical protein